MNSEREHNMIGLIICCVHGTRYIESPFASHPSINGNPDRLLGLVESEVCHRGDTAIVYDPAMKRAMTTSQVLTDLHFAKINKFLANH